MLIPTASSGQKTAGGSTPGGGPTATDTFTRANSTSTLGTTETGSLTWEYVNSVWGISSNEPYMVSVTGNRGHAVVDVGSTDMKVGCTIKSISTTQFEGVSARVVNKDNCYLFHNGSNAFLVRRQAGAQTIIDSTTAFSVNDEIELSVVEEAGGTRLIASVNGSPVLNVLDTATRPTTGTRGGIHAYIVGTARVDDFTITAL